jgi:CheY-like chemotaxis protein
MRIRGSRGPNQDTPIVACSARGARERLSEKDRAVFDAYLDKPLSPERLRTTLAQWAH